MKNCEKQLPQGYETVFHIDANDKKTGLILNLFAVLLSAVIVVPVVVTSPDKTMETLPLQLGVMAVGILLYTVLHELTHGVAYKALTKEKLTFGLRWSCAFCGVPDVYVYRKTALIALLAPFTVFTVVLLPLTVVLGVMQSVFYLPIGIVFGLHFGGCVGDLFMTGVLLTRYKDKATLLRDTGPEQWIYQMKE